MEPLHTLQWLYEMGVDEIITDTPIDRLAPAKPIASAQVNMVSTCPQKPNTPAVLGSKESIKLAKKVVQDITDLDSLHRTLENFTGCPTLKNTAKHTLVYTGTPTPTLLCIGDCPTNADEQSGRLLHGAMQNLLYRMVKSIGISDADIAYTNRSFWYPPGGRTLKKGEVDTCLPFVNKIIEITQPKHILILGDETAKTILQTTDNMAKINGKSTHITIAGVSYACTPTFGFKTIFSDPKRKHLVWQALNNIHI